MDNKPQISLLGLNHRVAPVEVRETAAFAPDEIPTALRTLSGKKGVAEGLILSTCNRTEIYTVTNSGIPARETLKTFLQESRPSFMSEKTDLLYDFCEEDAIRHLFRVAAGMDSMIIGEPQILGQVKDAFRIAAATGTTGPLLNRLLNFAFVAGKRVRSETRLSEGAVSVAYAAVELAHKIFKNLNRHSALLIGAGETGTLTARHLRERGIRELFVTNRTLSRAETLAAELNGRPIPFEQFSEKIPEVDVVIGATGSPEFVLDEATLRRVLPRRPARPLFLIDIAVPRDFDPEINRLDSVFLHDIDGLQQIVERNLIKRRQAIPQAEKIVDQEVAGYLKWRKSLSVTPTIVALRNQLDELRRIELEKYRHRVSPQEFEHLQHFSRGMMNKVLHLPMIQLKKYNDGELDGLLRIDVIREIFGLGDSDE